MSLFVNLVFVSCKDCIFIIEIVGLCVFLVI